MDETKDSPYEVEDKKPRQPKSELGDNPYQ
jgi:hypothetical protein